MRKLSHEELNFSNKIIINSYRKHRESLQQYDEKNKPNTRNLLRNNNINIIGGTCSSLQTQNIENEPIYSNYSEENSSD